MKCDLCNEEWRGGWTYETPSTASSLEDARDGRVWIEDPLWAVCDECHDIVEAGDRQRLLLRSLVLQLSSTLVVGNLDGAVRWFMQEEIARIQASFWNLKSVNPPKRAEVE